MSVRTRFVSASIALLVGVGALCVGGRRHGRSG
jgi:hypothetical protein